MLPLDVILVYHFEAVVFRGEVNIVHMERDFGNVITDGVKTLIHKPERIAVPVLKPLSRGNVRFASCCKSCILGHV